MTIASLIILVLLGIIGSFLESAQKKLYDSGGDDGGNVGCAKSIINFLFVIALLPLIWCLIHWGHTSRWL